MCDIFEGTRCDGWFLQRMDGDASHARTFLFNRRLTAQEALPFGGVSRLAQYDRRMARNPVYLRCDLPPVVSTNDTDGQIVGNDHSAALSQFQVTLGNKCFRTGPQTHLAHALLLPTLSEDDDPQPQGFPLLRLRR
jgi:hypothetical protein